MSSICYLCGRSITANQSISDDHVVPATLIKRAQPRVRGFDYGGHLPTHESCNNRFGPEVYVSKALDLLSVLNAGNMGPPLQHQKHPDISILPLNAECLSHFTERDLQFFKLIDTRNIDIASLSDPNFYSGRVKTNPTKDALYVALSVLAKSAAALLVKRHLDAVPSFWRIYANPYTGDLSDFDLSEFVGERKPFDTELRIWVADLPNNNWHIVYAVKDTLVYFTFVFNDRRRALQELKAAHADASTLSFLGATINEILVSGWREV